MRAVDHQTNDRLWRVRARRRIALSRAQPGRARPIRSVGQPVSDRADGRVPPVPRPARCRQAAVDRRRPDRPDRTANEPTPRRLRRSAPPTSTPRSGPAVDKTRPADPRRTTPATVATTRPPAPVREIEPPTATARPAGAELARRPRTTSGGRLPDLARRLTRWPPPPRPRRVALVQRRRRPARGADPGGRRGGQPEHELADLAGDPADAESDARPRRPDPSTSRRPTDPSASQPNGAATSPAAGDAAEPSAPSPPTRRS